MPTDRLCIKRFKTAFLTILNYKSEYASNIEHPDLNLQQDLEDGRVADHMDSIPGYHTPKRRQLAAVPELQKHQPYHSELLGQFRESDLGCM